MERVKKAKEDDQKRANGVQEMSGAGSASQCVDEVAIDWP